MYFKFQRKTNVLNVDDAYAHLQSISDSGDLEFKFYYTLSQREALRKNALSVDVSVFSKNVDHKRLFDGSSKGKIDSRSLIKNILLQIPDAKNADKQQGKLRVAGRTSDITTRINNEILPQLKSSLRTTDIPQLNRSVLKSVNVAKLRQSNEIVPVLSQMAHVSTMEVNTVLSASVDINLKKVMYDMVVRQSIDPSTITMLANRSISSTSAFQGTLRPSTGNEQLHSPSSRLLDYHLAQNLKTIARTSDQLNDSDQIHVVVQQSQDDIEVPVTVTIPRQRSKTAQSHFIVKFELRNNRSGAVIDSVSKQLDVTRHIQLFNTPKIAPTVRSARSEISSRVNLEIKQNDESATGVQVYKKSIYRSTTDVDDYSLVGSYDVKNTDQSLLVQVEMPRQATNVYRVIPIGKQGTQGFEYTNVVISPSRFSFVKSISLITLNVDNGVKVEISKIPTEVISIQVLVRNMTTHETDYRTVGSDVSLIDSTIRTADHLVSIDTAVAPGNIYEYTARLYFSSGISDVSGNSTIEFNQPADGKVDTKITNVNVDMLSDPNVTFTVSTTIVDTNIDIVKNLLQRQDLYDQFKNDILKEREFLKSLIAHNVQRVDISSGAREDFGIITDTSFSDKDIRKNQSISALKIGHRYRYEVTPLLRAPETMFESLSKQQTDSVTSKQYTFNPSKFLHPLALTRGILVTSQGLKTRYSKEAMSHGIIGNVQSVEVSFDNDTARVQDASVTRFDRNFNLITWKLLGSMDNVDHFLIIKDVNGVRTTVGKSHSEFQYGNCQFIHELASDDDGTFTYIIVPVFNDYNVGVSTTTNPITIGNS